MLSVEQALAEVRSRLEPLAARTAWVGVDGMGASGKTTWAERLVASLPGSSLVGVDDFARPGVATWDHGLFTRQVLRPLLDGHPARWQRWDWRSGRPGGWCTAEPGHPVVVEGVSATDTAVPVPWDVLVWVEAPAGVRHARALARDGETAWREQWSRDWIPSEEAYRARQRPDLRADVVVDGR